MAQFTLNLVPERRVWTVSQLTARVRDLLESAFDDLWVEGELSNTHASQAGHIYFTLKDDKAQIRCALSATSCAASNSVPRTGSR